MLGSHRLGTIIEVQHPATKLLDGYACMEHWPTVLLKLKLVPHLWLYKEYRIYGIYWSICIRVPTTVIKTFLAKIKWCSFLPHMIVVQAQYKCLYCTLD